MRTKIRGSNEVPSGQLVVDEWVPFTFRAYRKLLLNPDIWLVGNFKTSLLEMKVERQSREILGVALPLYNRPIEQGIPSPRRDEIVRLCLDTVSLRGRARIGSPSSQVQQAANSKRSNCVAPVREKYASRSRLIRFSDSES
jgi:hypothetical protein